MTEEEWLQSNNPGPMLESLQNFRAERKWRLLLCECSRLAPNELLSANVIESIEMAEKHAEGTVTLD
jgi:hypothetical protein